MHKPKEKVQEAETVKKCVEQTVQPTEQRKGLCRRRLSIYAQNIVFYCCSVAKENASS